MEKRAFICSKQHFPRGSAGANYIQFLALAMKEVGFNPIVISSGSYQNCSHEGEKYFYKGIEVYNPFKFENKIAKHFEFIYGDALRFIGALKEYNVNKNDVIIAYLLDERPLKSILNFSKKNKIKSAACVVEWLPKENFTNNRMYKSYMRAMRDIVSQYDIILPISHYIAEKYKKSSANVFVLPIMADTSEYSYKPKVYVDEKRKFIFPANGMMKDSMSNMLEGLARCPKEIRDKVEFHITNYSKEKVEKITQEFPDEIKERLDRMLVIHKWLEYDELIELYKKMNFLLLARDENQMTLANFPSKVPETMTYGIIPVVSEVGDYTRIYLKDNENSLVFKGSSVAVCIEAIVRATSLDNEEVRRLEKAARETAVNKFDYHNWLESLSKLFSS